MLSIILTIIALLGWILLGLSPLLSQFTTNNIIHLTAIVSIFGFYSFTWFYILSQCIKTMLAMINLYQMRDDVLDEVKGIVVKREVKKRRFFDDSYNVTIAYEGMNVTANSYVLYQTCREGDSVNVVLHTRPNFNRVSRYLALD